MKDFDKIYEAEQTEIGCIFGSRRVLMIKTGQGGSIYGDERKYLGLAWEIRRKYGFSVFVSATVTDSREVFEKDVRLMEALLGTREVEIYYLGVSKGGLIGVWYGADEPRIVRMLSINAPLMVNFHRKTVPGAIGLGRERLTMLYGSLDPSYGYIPFAEKYANIEIVEGADHNLKGSPVTLKELTLRYLLCADA